MLNGRYHIVLEAGDPVVDFAGIGLNDIHPHGDAHLGRLDSFQHRDFAVDLFDHLAANRLQKLLSGSHHLRSAILHRLFGLPIGDRQRVACGPVHRRGLAGEAGLLLKGGDHGPIPALDAVVNPVGVELAT